MLPLKEVLLFPASYLGVHHHYLPLLRLHFLFFIFFYQLSDVEVVESLVQLASLSKGGNGPTVHWRKLIVSEQMSRCWADQPH